jgi:outer membrane protein assembly factor BamE
MKKITTLLTVGLLLTSCSIAYHPALEQGNVITTPMISKLKPGMTKTQVSYLMGTPVLQSPYQQDRWDYVYCYKPGSIKDEKLVAKRVTIFFAHGKVKEVQTV